MFDLMAMGTCCVAKVIDEWGGKEEETVRFDDAGKRYSITDYESYKKWASGQLKRLCAHENRTETHTSMHAGWGEKGLNEFEDMRNKAVYTATLRKDQVWALLFAKEVGFTRTRPLHKGRYSEEVTMRLLWITSNDLFNWNEAN